MKFSVNDFEKVGEVIRQTEVYKVMDIKKLEHLVISMTVLHPKKETKGHSHEGKEEVYFFREGSGTMQLDEEKFGVKAGDAVLIPAGSFHRVFNPGDSDLVFVCVFEKYGDRK